VALEALDALPEALGARRATLGLSLRAAATQIGTTNATVHRLESGGGANEVTYRLVLAWLDDTEEAPRG
jgi:transcriptional regulator with XRE-family HTH domain